MTKEEWFSSDSIFQMLEFSKISERKCRLFACACVRHIWWLLNPNQRNAIEAAEKYADDNALYNEMFKANRALSFDVYNLYSPKHYIHEACDHASHIFNHNNCAAYACVNIARSVSEKPYPRSEKETQWQANLLRHMVKPYD